MKINHEVIQRFFKKVEKTPKCWNWTGCLVNGYGQFFLGKKQYAHRISYSILHGEIPKGKCLDHLCRNRKCVNPNHLEPVSYKENIIRGAKNQDQFGEKHPWSKLSDRDILKIKELAKYNIPRPQIAQMFGTSRRNVYYTIRGRSRRRDSRGRIVSQPQQEGGAK